MNSYDLDGKGLAEAAYTSAVRRPLAGGASLSPGGSHVVLRATPGGASQVVAVVSDGASHPVLDDHYDHGRGLASYLRPASLPMAPSSEAADRELDRKVAEHKAALARARAEDSLRGASAPALPRCAVCLRPMAAGCQACCGACTMAIRKLMATPMGDGVRAEMARLGLRLDGGHVRREPEVPQVARGA